MVYYLPFFSLSPLADDATNLAEAYAQHVSQLPPGTASDLEEFLTADRAEAVAGKLSLIEIANAIVEEREVSNQSTSLPSQPSCTTRPPITLADAKAACFTLHRFFEEHDSIASITAAFHALDQQLQRYTAANLRQTELADYEPLFKKQKRYLSQEARARVFQDVSFEGKVKRVDASPPTSPCSGDQLEQEGEFPVGSIDDNAEDSSGDDESTHESQAEPTSSPESDNAVTEQDDAPEEDAADEDSFENDSRSLHATLFPS
jgi:hypothetical protein